MAIRQHYCHINWANEALRDVIAKVVTESEEKMEPFRNIINDVIRWSMKPRLLRTLGVRIRLCNSQTIFKNSLESLRICLQDLGTVEELEKKEDNLHDGWMEIDDSRKRKRGDEDSVFSGESDLKNFKMDAWVNNIKQQNPEKLIKNKIKIFKQRKLD